MDKRNRSTEMPHLHRLLPGPALAGRRIQMDEQHHLLIIDEVVVRCTPTEYRILAVLLHQAERCVPYEQLLACLHQEERDPAFHRQARDKIIHVISDLRGKLWSFDLRIVAVLGVGYLLLSSSQESE